ncbi:multi-sensor signal transduction histidine kinase [Actinoplanes sp. SE50]|uniref:sensor histidine kinase n=1 Tax=unclassified Actinoplanes TaxID=2626549 RepID=UPI00023ECED5|nr:MULTISPECIES: ATP-binding protein [unclassified Actinoplanes]AEV85506.1 multi-sensor signal transduction histidine kinase [Actinoplanes sp. SE50/110]ATO83899.1 multi-sensor signal transduction histidine kinase [Actinoplanes sp. SE50]SLM01309.1 multi-sensor signal transduction histidine kinase [Actinoplanes sp. SE50/110]
MPELDVAVLTSPQRLRAVASARRELPVLPVPLDGMARMAARMLRTPMAVVTLVQGGEEEFLGLFGLPEPFAATRRAALQFSLCAFVVCADDVVAVDDTLAEERLREHPVVRQWGVRSFAGIPLHDTDGQPVGAITVIDIAHRSWTAPDLTRLTYIADMLGPIPAGTPSAEAAMDLLCTDHRGTGPQPAAGVAAQAQVQQAFIEALLDSLQVGVVACDRDRRPVVVNRMMRHLFGLHDGISREEALTAGLARVHHLDGTPIAPDELVVTRALNGETVRDAASMLCTPGAPDRYLLVNGQPLHDHDGNRLGAVSTVLDITGRRRNERFRDCQLRVARILNSSDTVEQAAPRLLSAVGEALGWQHVGLWLIDDVADVARPAGHWEAPGVHIEDLIPQRLTRNDPGLVGTAWATGRPIWIADLATTTSTDPRLRDFIAAAVHRDLRTAVAIPICENDTALAVLVCLSALGEHDDAPLIGLLTDIAEQIGRLLARRRAAELDLQLASAKDDFLTLISHELRTPLTTVLACTSMLADDPQVDPDTRQMLATVTRSTTAVQRIIDELIDLAGIESGHHPLHKRATDLVTVVTGALAAAPHPDDIEIHTDLPPSLVVDGDPGRLRQIVDHLLSNAIKYSPRGGDVRISLSADRGDVAELAITDTGIGIPEADRAGLFTRFHRAGNARHTAVTGTGLGLALVRALVEAHGGTVTHDPAHHPGTRITVRLPR